MNHIVLLEDSTAFDDSAYTHGSWCHHSGKNLEAAAAPHTYAAVPGTVAVG